MKRVALLMESWKRAFTYAWPSGILKKINETGEDISLYIFNASANWSQDTEYNRGEHNIFRLPDLTEFDGILVDLNNTADQGVLRETLDRIRSSGVPAVALNNRFPGLYSVGINNKLAMREILQHLWVSHDCRRFWFIMGPEDNFENRERESAILDFLTEKKIPGEDTAFYYEDFDHNTGVHGFRQLYESRNALPDAIVCANDNIAVGVLSEAERQGRIAPDDFLITGFDDLDKSRYYTPRITTVSFTREDAGYESMSLLMDIWNGYQPEQERFTRSRTILWESCGCRIRHASDMRKKMKENILWSAEESYFEANKLALESRMMQAATIQELMQAIPDSIPSFHCDSMHLVVDKSFSLLDRERDAFDFERRSQEMDESLLRDAWPSEMDVMLAYENGRLRSVGGGHVSGLFPFFNTEKKGQTFLFLPIHFRGKCVGYLAVENAVYLMEKQFIFAVVHALSTGMEQLYNKRRMANLNKALSILYNHDSMTRLYNRTGYEEFAERFYQKLLDEYSGASVIYMDLDRLKEINDSCGHEAGDYAILCVADLLRRFTTEDTMCFRLGGDEFLVLSRETDESELRRMLGRVREELLMMQKEKDIPVEFSVSAGYVIAGPEERDDLERLVQEADDRMYRQKISRRVNRGA